MEFSCLRRRKGKPLLEHLVLFRIDSREYVRKMPIECGDHPEARDVFSHVSIIT